MSQNLESLPPLVMLCRPPLPSLMCDIIYGCPLMGILGTWQRVQRVENCARGYIYIHIYIQIFRLWSTYNINQNTCRHLELAYQFVLSSRDMSLVLISHYFHLIFPPLLLPSCLTTPLMALWSLFDLIPGPGCSVCWPEFEATASES